MLLRSVTSSLPARREEGVRDQQAQSQRHQQGKENRRAKRKAERDNSLVGGLQILVDRMSKPTFSGDPLVRLKQFIEAAENDSKSTGKDKKSKRSNEKSESSCGGSSWIPWCERCGEDCCWQGGVGRRRWEKPENPMLTLSRNATKQLPIKPEGLHASHWRGTFVDLADFIPRVSTAKTGDHIIAGVATEEPLELWRFVGARRDQRDFDCPADDENIPPNTEAFSAYARAAEGWCGVQRVVMLQWRTSAFPLAWKPTAVSYRVTVAESVTLRVCRSFRSFSRKRSGGVFSSSLVTRSEK